MPCHQRSERRQLSSASLDGTPRPTATTRALQLILWSSLPLSFLRRPRRCFITSGPTLYGERAHARGRHWTAPSPDQIHATRKRNTSALRNETNHQAQQEQSVQNLAEHLVRYDTAKLTQMLEMDPREANAASAGRRRNMINESQRLFEVCQRVLQPLRSTLARPPLLPRTNAKYFRTPALLGDHWDHRRLNLSRRSSLSYHMQRGSVDLPDHCHAAAPADEATRHGPRIAAAALTDVHAPRLYTSVGFTNWSVQ